MPFLGTGEQMLRQRFLLRTRQQFEELTGQPAPAGKQYFKVNAAVQLSRGTACVVTTPCLCACRDS